MPDLPKIPPAAKVVVAGTYIAEQTSKTSFELVNASYKEIQQSQSHRPVTSKRQRPARGEVVKYTLLPALASIDPLLSSPVKDGGMENPKPESSCGPQKPESSSARAPESDARPPDNYSSQHPGSSSARVTGSSSAAWKPKAKPTKPFAEACEIQTDRSGWPKFHGVSRCQMSDIEAMEYLTRPPTGKPQKRPKEIEADDKMWERVSSSRKGKRIHENHRALFEQSLQGTEFKVNLAVQRPTCVPRQSPRVGTANRIEDLTIPVLPENAVTAFFEYEEMHQRNQKNYEKMRKAIPKKVITKESDDQVKDSSKDKDKEIHSGPSTAEKRGLGKKTTKAWNSVLDAVLTEKTDEAAEVQKLTPVRREGCEALRLLVFGQVGNEDCKTQKDKDAVFAQAVGTKEQVKTLYGLWQRLDDDNSGRVDFKEFHAYVSKVGQARLAEKAMVSLLGKKSSFAIEDMMRLMWPYATIHDVKQMRAWGMESLQSLEDSRVKTPPVLPKEELDGLCQNFRWFDNDASGTVSISELVDSGLLDKDQATRYLKEWDTDGTGDFTCLEFCQMLCPSGFRADESSKVGTDKNGNRIVLDEASHCWVERDYKDDMSIVKVTDM